MTARYWIAVALAIAPVSVGHAAVPEEASIRAVIDRFREAIIAKDKAALDRLPASTTISFMSTLDEATFARIRKGRPAARRHAIGSYTDFVKEITSSPDKLEESFTNIRIESDGAVANVYFDYDFRENGVVTNYGHESWGMIRTDDGWKIASIIYSITLPEPAK